MGEPDDWIILQGLRFYGYHGVHDFEQARGQPFVVDLRLRANLKRAGETDDLEATVNYGLVYRAVKDIVENRRYKLIEALAEAVAQRVLQDFPTREVDVTVRKPKAPLPGEFEHVAVQITRRKEVSAAEAYLGLGSNLGDRLNYLVQAVKHLQATPGVQAVEASSVYETAAWGKTDQPAFLNLAVRLTTTLSPRALLSLCLAIEAQLGRVREEQWGPRVIDLDVLLYGDATINEPDLQVPHPRLTERAFVLVPLLELRPDPRHQAALDALGDQGVALWMAAPDFRALLK